MADDAGKRKQGDWLSRPYGDYQKHSEKQKRLFHFFCDYVTEHGGWVTSAPGQKQVRFEVPALSEIPIRLRERNIPLTYIGESTRVTSSNVALPISIFETKLG
jgi:hypothetical protein